MKSSETRHTSVLLNANDTFYMFDIDEVSSSLAASFIDDWHTKLWSNGSGTGGSKLRTYRLFKSTYSPEIYLLENMPISHRSALAKFRCGTAPIRIETGVMKIFL